MQELKPCQIEKYKVSLEKHRADKRSWGPKAKNIPPEETPALSHDQLVKMAAKFLKYDKNCGIVVEELRSWSGIFPDAMGWQSGASFMVEAKASRSDFFADRKKHHYGTRYAVAQWYIVPWGLIKPDELPEGYGLLYAGGDGIGHIHEIIQAPWIHENVSESLHCQIFYSLLRRHKITGIQKEFQLEETRADTAQCDILGRTLKGVNKAHDRALERVEALEGVLVAAREALNIARRRILFLGVAHHHPKHMDANDKDFLPKVEEAIAKIDALTKGETE